MRTICFATQKGGSGKTTLAASLAVAAMQAGEKVYLVDLDPQQSLASWGRRRKADEPGIDTTDAIKLPSAIGALGKAGYTLAVIDTAGVDSALATAGMRESDLIIIPVRASALDLEGCRPTISACARLGKPFAFVINSCAAGKTARLTEAGKAVSLLGALLEPAIVQRADHVDAIGFGLGVSEHNPQGKAAVEMAELWQSVSKRIGGANVQTAIA